MAVWERGDDGEEGAHMRRPCGSRGGGRPFAMTFESKRDSRFRGNDGWANGGAGGGVYSIRARRVRRHTSEVERVCEW